MTTTIERVNKETVDKLMEDPNWALTISSVLKKMRDGFYSWQLPVIIQKWEGLGNYDIYDAYPFAIVYTWMGTTKILAATINIGLEPSKDKNLEENNEKLKSLWYPFSGEFWGGTQGEDGYINVEEEIEFDMTHLQTQEQVVKSFSGNFPLEVGYISAAKTMYHLQSFGRLARWPYHSDEIFLLQKIETGELE